MPVPYRDADEVDEWGTAAFLLLEAVPDRAGYRGALFQINARGEPIEFTYNRVATPNTFLWRPADLRRAALKGLTASLLDACSRVPRLIFGRATDVGPELFGQDIQVALPVCRLAPATAPPARSAREVAETLDRPEPLLLLWSPAPPAEGSPERALTRRFARHGLLLEPFERAAVGLDEVYGQAAPVAS